MKIARSALCGAHCCLFVELGKYRAATAVAILALLLPGGLLGQTPVLTQHNNNARTGAYTTETILTPANVNQTSFGKLFGLPVDGRIYAQPLYVPSLAISGKGTHNVVFVATEHDSIYAFDADSNGGGNSTPLWQITLLDAAHGASSGATTVPNGDVSSSDLVPEIGITGTPVIDPTTGTLYVVGKTKEGTTASPTYVQRLHALDITTGAEKFGGPVTISASVPGTGNGSSGGTLAFDPKWHLQRAGLLLQNGVLYIGFGSHGDNGPWHGWILSYKAATLQQISAFCATPNGSGAGVWMAGTGLAADLVDPVNKPYGRMFIATGNGSFSASPPYTNAMSYGDGLVDLDLTGGTITVQDSFTPNNQAALNASDEDLASGGVLLLPDQTSGGHTHLLAQAGKEGKIYLVDRDNMGGYNSTDNVVQEISGQTGGLWSVPAFWNNMLYTWGINSYLMSFALSNGLLSSTPTATASAYSGYPGATPSVSANGTTNGIVWAANTQGYDSSPVGNTVLFAFDASNVATELYDSTQNAARDIAGVANKFAVPTIANGKVYVGTGTELDVYGLLGAPIAAAPVISPGSETFSGSLSVTISDSTSGANIYYTTDGSTPTTSSTRYTGPISVSTTETITAIASATGYLVSPASSQTYTLQNQVAAPTFSPAATTFASSLSVTISDATSGAAIHYTVDGSTPTSSSPVYASPIALTATTTLKAIAMVSGMINSNVTAATYTYAPAGGGTGSDFANGFAGASSYMTFNGVAGLDDSRLQLTDGGLGEASSAWFNTPVNIQTFTNDFMFQISNPLADGFTFTIQNTGLNALGHTGGGLGYGPDSPWATGQPSIGKSIAVKFDIYNNAGEGSDSTGLYTNGASPTIPAIDLTGTGIDLHSGDTFSVHMVYDGATLTMTITDGVTNTSYTTSWKVNIPQIVGGSIAYVGFTGGAGGESSSQKIETWTFAPTSGSSTPAATPAFSPAGGSYLGTQTVSISDATGGATIFYTTDGSTPATSAGGSTAQYTGPLTISATETIKAIATAPGYSASAVASATYTIESQAAAPTFSPGSGTYPSAQTVAISSSTSGASIYYTLDGTTPNTTAGGSTLLYSSPITISSTTTVKAVAAASGYYASSVSTATYTISSGSGGSINFSSGFAAGGMVLNGSAALSGTRLRLTNGGASQAATAWYNAPVNISSFTSAFTFQVTPGTNPLADGFTFIIQGKGTTALGPAGGGLGYGSYTCGATSGGISSSIAIKFDLYDNCGEGSDSTGLYTNGASPMTPAVDMTSSGIDLHSGHVFNVNMTYDGTNLNMTIADATTAASFSYTWPVNIASAVGSTSAWVGFGAGAGGYTAVQDVISWTFTPAGSAPTAATPTFSPGGGTYTSAQSVTLTDTTSGATIYYTIDGSAPTTSSTKYTGAISVSTTTTINAIAVASGYNNSSVGSATYTISLPTAATPTFSPAGGTYASSQSVTISDTTPGSTIYYTTDGSTPTTASTKYSAPVSVASSLTLKAIANASGYSTSGVASASYTIASQAAAPTFNPAPGTYSSTQTVTISSSTSSASIYYTLDGSTPNTTAGGSTVLYSSPITISATTTVKAIATASGYSASNVSTATYTISSGSGGSINFSSGFAVGGMVLNGSAALSGTRLRLTNGGASQAATAWYSAPVNISSFTSAFSFQVTPGTNPLADGFTFIIQGKGTTALGPAGGGLGYGSYTCGATSGGISSSIAIKFDLYDNCGEGSDSTGLYTNGASPMTPAVDMTSSGIDLHGGHVFNVSMSYNGTNLSMTISDATTAASFSRSWPVNISSVVGGSTAYVGFGAGTGGYTAVQDIISWTYTPGP